MDDTMDSKNEMISALADGQLGGEAFAGTVQVVCAEREALATWHAYHVIGDVLRSGEAAYASPCDAFVARLSERLGQEECPRPVTAAHIAAAVAAGRPAAANDGAFRWKVMAGVASFAAVAAVGWSVLGTAAGTAAGGAGTQMAAVPASAPGIVLTRSGEGMMIRDARLDELMAAHRQFGGASALQVPAGFLRNATFEGPAR